MGQEMRRKRQALTAEECSTVLRRGTSGVLALAGRDEYPYAVPLSYIYDAGKLYFHCAKVGHKLDAIADNPCVSFCVIDQDRVVPEEYTTYFRSVIVFGRARVLEDEAEKRAALELLAVKYSPSPELAEGRAQEIARQLHQVCIIELIPAEITGKEAIELARLHGR